MASEIITQTTDVALTTVAIFHVAPDQHRQFELALAAEIREALSALNPTAYMMLSAQDGLRLAVYIQWPSEDGASTFLRSKQCDRLEGIAQDFGATGSFRQFRLCYVNDSTTGPQARFWAAYPGVVAINEVRTKGADVQDKLTEIMIRTDSVAKRLPFHHSTNIHASTDGFENFNLLQFRWGIVRIIIWFILRFGRTTEALKYGTPDVHFYRIVSQF